jgi:ArsR family metal-binding transcriptional regulator
MYCHESRKQVQMASHAITKQDTRRKSIMASRPGSSRHVEPADVQLLFPGQSCMSCPGESCQAVEQAPGTCMVLFSQSYLM